MDICYFEQSTHLSETVVTDGFVSLLDMVSEDTEADVKSQTQDMLAQIDRWLEKCGSDKVHILEATVFLANMDGYAVMNKAWDEWVVAGHAPTRACVQAGLADSHRAMKIKVSVVQAVWNAVLPIRSILSDSLYL